MIDEEAVNEIAHTKPEGVKLAASTQTTGMCSTGSQTDPEREEMAVGTIIKPTNDSSSSSDLHELHTSETYVNSIIKEEEAADNEVR
eukprot:5936526-Lingulodinium_polyedra.AAC.1